MVRRRYLAALSSSCICIERRKSDHARSQFRLLSICCVAILRTILANSSAPRFALLRRPCLSSPSFGVGSKPVPMESKRSGCLLARCGQRSFRSQSATTTGLLNFNPPSLKVYPVFLWKNDLKYLGAAEVARALRDVSFAYPVLTLDWGNYASQVFSSW